MESFSKIDVSIIIPCYNDVRYIRDAVDSASAQTYSSKEIIVVDDGSNKETKAVLKEIGSKIDQLITQENQGVVVARNNAIKFARGKYILTLDSDDFFDEDFLEKAVLILNENPKVGMVTCHARIIEENGKIHIQIPNGENYNKAIFRNNVYASLLFRKNCWEEVNGYDLNMSKGFEDWEFNISVSKAGWGIHVINEPLFNYRLKKQSRNTEAKKHQKELRRYVFNKHRDIAINNFDETINFFLNEIEDLKEINREYENCYSYKLGFMLLYPVRKFKKLFKI